MPRINRQYRPQVFGLLQSAITSAIAALIANPKGMALGPLMLSWSTTWLLTWLSMIPVVLLAAPYVRRLTDLIVQRED
ncbi:DUF2798 domain-containing protein [Ectopseudomonas khazarica]|uniref:DUF2798 domain-containing protein n=1 Tax=Ectopseudomonas khazarica TaxID=2502979 RepID=A0ABW7M7H7_9GAMM